jgi:hypothetical protein
VGPRAGLGAEGRGKILCLCQGSNPGRTIRSQTFTVGTTVYFLVPDKNYPGSSHNFSPNFVKIVRSRTFIYMDVGPRENHTRDTRNRYKILVRRDITNFIWQGPS